MQPTTIDLALYLCTRYPLQLGGQGSVEYTWPVLGIEPQTFKSWAQNPVHLATYAYNWKLVRYLETIVNKILIYQLYEEGVGRKLIIEFRFSYYVRSTYSVIIVVLVLNNTQLNSGILFAVKLQVYRCVICIKCTHVSVLKEAQVMAKIFLLSCLRFSCNISVKIVNGKVQITLLLCWHIPAWSGTTLMNHFC